MTNVSDFGERLRFEQALSWAARVHETDFDDWDGHERWLGSHPANAGLYGRAVLALDDAATQLASEPVVGGIVVDDDAPIRGAGWRLAGASIGVSAIAACGLLAVFSFPLHQTRPQTVSVPIGQTRMVKLAGGTMLALNGGSELRIDAARRATLTRGEVFASVHHDDNTPFELMVGDRLFRDVGTAFNASASQTAIRLDVSEGAVLYEPDGASLNIGAGQGLIISGGNVERYIVPASSIGSWRQGRLSYRNASVSRVAEDLTRVIGVPIKVSPSVGNRSFTGVIISPRDDAATRRTVGSLLDVSVEIDRTGWHVSPRTPAY